jgi:hypothetical protein
MSNAARAQILSDTPAVVRVLPPVPAVTVAHEIASAKDALRALEEAVHASDLPAARQQIRDVASRVDVVLSRGSELRLRVAALEAECRRLATTNANVVAFYSEQLDRGRGGRERE